MTEEQNIHGENLPDGNEHARQQEIIDEPATSNKQPNRKHGSTSPSRPASQKEALERIFS